MKASTRLMLATALFLAWIGWLAFLAATTTRPIILSQPQFLVSKLDVTARLSADQGRPATAAHVSEVHWPTEQQGLKDQTIHVTNLAYCTGWQGPGEYILPLIKVGDAYEVVKVPPSPGFVPGGTSPGLRIYPRTPNTLRQLQAITSR
jgi:hypothetical protein